MREPLGRPAAVALAARVSCSCVAEEEAVRLALAAVADDEAADELLLLLLLL